ncbi:hypothetical protein S40293_04862 [Stachybotrys chartarum IBT 40293]|nr:hypothetical protein S40293_04862 [Stachybotrys chartarum IBT 40293]
MARSLPVVASALLGLVAAQHPGSAPEIHPRLKTWKCTIEGGCVEQNTAIVLDSLAHPVYQINTPEYNCGDWGNPPNATACPDVETCQANCVMDGISDYSEFGIVTEDGTLHLQQLSEDGALVTPRVYLLAEDEQTYEMLYLTGQEFSFDVDVSRLPCGMNGALYLSEMLPDGGQSELNTGGAYYGTGYCDAQCYTTPFINGEPNLEGYGSCCNELDIWEANSRSTLLAPHPCNKTGLYLCSGEECGWDGVCDEWGCAYNPYQNGNPDYYGLGMRVNTSRPFTVVTQFPADEDGILREYHRIYIQDGRIIRNAPTQLDNLPKQNFMDDEYCIATGSATRYMDLGATAGMGASMSRGMVLAMSIWWDEGGNMQWLDGTDRGPCNATEGAPSNIRNIQPDTASERCEHSRRDGLSLCNAGGDLNCISTEAENNKGIRYDPPEKPDRCYPREAFENDHITYSGAVDFLSAGFSAIALAQDVRVYTGTNYDFDFQIRRVRGDGTCHYAASIGSRFIIIWVNLPATLITSKNVGPLRVNSSLMN